MNVKRKLLTFFRKFMELRKKLVMTIMTTSLKIQVNIFIQYKIRFFELGTYYLFEKY